MDTPRACSVARSLEIVGERWSLLVLREVLLGVRRFADIQRHTGAPRAVLTQRLRRLVDAGILERRDYRPDGERTRQEYHPTPAGRELQPVLVALMQWGDRHLAGPDGPPVRMEHHDCGGAVHAHLVCEHGHALPGDGRGLRAVPRDVGAG
ncbi:MAG: helix-turn-helix transcriptional regulator [Solirubrobacteraceae bacterium]|nr:helix-turn-helix transcriptional regulator [Solirubrobacteraceae bacterium]